MAADHSHPPLAHDAQGNASPAEHTHPDWKTYRWVALILGLLTAMEVYVYYLPSFVQTKMFVPTLLLLSAIKFAIVVLFYMHLKYDAKLFRALFGGPLTLACFTIVGLLFLFGHLAIHF
jgi:cytochrome c oxidase subunit 4